MTVEISDSAANVFGGPEKLAESIFSVLKNPVVNALGTGVHPLHHLASVSRAELLEWFANSGVNIRKIMTPQWDESTKEYWKQRFIQSGSGCGIGDSGSSAPFVVLLETFVCLEALGEICKAKSAPLVDDKTLANLREKYQYLRG